ncbi:ATP-binding protein [Virgibacillus halodenitrificans]|uniref:ATP-binding protein n=1 Tax=Virgibacillus halodenitrificans TaxID=1482 RepID=UPI001F1EA38D|nr:ATP-binding protein [Virgibacillus halodenitrificans]
MPKIDVGITTDDLINVMGNVTSPFVVLSELVKNGVDANSKAVTIKINTEDNSIMIRDNGDGFYIEDIEDLGRVASSRKKRSNKLRNNEGQMLLGSKGLAIFSVFSLGDYITIKTKNKVDECYLIEWDKNSTSPNYELIQDRDFSYGSEIIISNIDKEDMLLLQSNKELQKFKHISLASYKKNLTLPKVVVTKDNKRVDLDVNNLEEFEDEFENKVTFKYNSETNSLTLKYITKDKRISDKEVTFDLNNEIDAKKRINEEYHFKPDNLAFEDYITGGLIEQKNIEVPNFEGVWYVKTNRKTAKMNDFGFGVKLFVNNFALYNFLNENYDWLNLADINGNKRTNSFKKHNVYGYLNFPNFNDIEQGLKISNERGGFIENVHYYKFFEILYLFVLFPVINIDVAIRNNKIKQPIATNTGLGNTTQVGKKTGTKAGPITGTSIGRRKGTETGAKVGTEKGVENKNLIKTESILKVKRLKLESGEQIYLKDSTIINTGDLNLNEIKIVPQRQMKINQDNVFLGNNEAGNYYINYFLDDIKETLHIEVSKRKIKGEELNLPNFFDTSNHFIGDIDLSEINDLVKQLYGLEYDEKYLLYVISFRAILEDLTKKYLNKQGKPLSGNFKNNMINMLLDIQEVLKTNKNDPLKDEKVIIMQKFKGYDALNNFIIGVNVKFNNENYDKFLHSLTHNPAKIHRDLALEIANDLILPLYKLEKLLTEKGIIPSI